MAALTPGSAGTQKPRKAIPANRSSQQTRDREAEVVKLRRGGLTFDQIAKQLDISVSTAYDSWKRANARLMQDDIETIRATEMDRLDIVQSAIWPKVLRGEIPAAQTLLRIMERRSRMLGIDLPVKVQAEVTTVASGASIDAEVARLAALLGETQKA